MSETPQQAYISKVHLKGYKSIRDLEIDFKPGLNIIIGPNGSGKTNFLEFIDIQNRRSLNKEYSEMQIPNLETKISFFQKLKFNSPFEYYLRKFKTENATIKNNGHPTRILKVSEIIEDINHHVILKRNYELSAEGLINFSVKYINDDLKYDIQDLLSNNYLTFNNPLNELLKNKIIVNIYRQLYEETEILDEDGDLIDKEISYIQSAFIRNIGIEKLGFIENVISFSFLDRDINSDEFYATEVIGGLKFPSHFLNIIRKYTPISEVLFDIDSITYEHEKGNSIDLDNIFLIFLVNGNWIKWNELSDGTKRMFYLFGNVYFSENKKILFLEEPELGIHPDQLHKLMDFLIEQSKEKQIIITTHSPEVLNAIHPDELDRIIVTRYDAEKGTVMHKLTPEQAKEMGERIKEGDMFLSDRWVHLNLEDDIFNANKTR